MSGARPLGTAPKALPHARGVCEAQPGGHGAAEPGDRERRTPGKAKKKKSKVGRDAAAGGAKRGAGTAPGSKKRKKPGKGAASSVDQILSSSLRTLKRMDISGVSNSSSSRDDTPPAASPQPQAPLPAQRHRSAGPGPGSSAAARPSAPAVVCIPLPSSDSPDAAPRHTLMKAAKQGAQGVSAGKKKRQKLQHSVADGAGAVGGPLVRGGGRLTGDAGTPVDSADLWYFRCRRILLTALDEHCYSVIVRSVATWPAADIHRLCSEWEPHDFAAAFSHDNCTPERIASLLAIFDARYVAKCCETWQPEELHDILPRLAAKKGRQVLEHLYFKSDDPHLSTSECKQLLLAFSEIKRRKVCRKLDMACVEHVMRNSGDESGSDEGSERGAEGDDSYESSFIDDEEDDDDHSHGDGSVMQTS